MPDPKSQLPNLHFYERLSFKLLRWVLITALAAGGILSTAHILLDASNAAQEMDDEAAQILAVIKEPATQAVYAIDAELASQVIDGLFQQRAIHYASISHPDGTMLAYNSRPLRTTMYRWVTDLIFQQERQYSVALLRDNSTAGRYGDLTIVLDTAETADLFLKRSVLLFVTGLLKSLALALILFALYHYLLTAPLMTLVRALTQVDPAAPAQKKMPVPRHHEQNELGLWVRTANNLLQLIDDNHRQRAAAEARALQLSQHDLLTGLPNRAMFQNHLQITLDDAKRSNQKVALLCIGIDDFTSVNDQYGYSIGDRLLKLFSERLITQDSAVHTVSRLNGDQFALVQYNIDGAYRASMFAEALLQDLNRPFVIDQQPISLSSTIGIALYPDDGDDADKLLQKAEQTMTLAKEGHRHQFQFYVAQVDTELRERKQLEKDLAGAMANGELYLVYQPQVDMAAGVIFGAEALIRWNHPTRGFVPPDIFIPIAESNDSIKEIGAWVIQEACHQMRLWSDAGVNLRVAINLSAVQLRQRGIVELVGQAIHTNRIAPNQLELEITETSFMESLGDAVETLHAIRKFGVQCAVDDFGTGYSSLSYLKQLPIDKIKIDKQFIRDLMTDDDDTSIVHAIIQLGRSLKLNVIAEGVETAEQVAYLTANGCYEAQGYYYSKPLTAPDFLQLYRSFNQQRQAAGH